MLDLKNLLIGTFGDTGIDKIPMEFKTNLFGHVLDRRLEVERSLLSLKWLEREL